MLTRLDLRGADRRRRRSCPVPPSEGDEPVAAVRAILDDVRDKGDVAVRELTARFDGVELDDLRVRPEACAAALARIPADLRAALEHAAGAHRGLPPHPGPRRRPCSSATASGVESRAVPVDRAGCYVPGGRAVYPSTVLMTALPAWVAGVPEIVLAVPPDRTTGMPPDATLAAAAIAGVDEVYRIGGAQAIAALAYGTESIAAGRRHRRPGQRLRGRRQAHGGRARAGSACPSAFAGPSEVVVVADASVPADFAAIDVVVQAEHGPDGLAWLVTWDEARARRRRPPRSARIAAASPRRADLEATLGRSGYAVLVDGPEQAMAVANAIAPEHLELMCADAEALVPLVRHAGAVFCGPWSPASLGDYLAGPSHVLPTNGSARFGQALTVADFTKHVHVVTADRRRAAGRGAAP